MTAALGLVADSLDTTKTVANMSVAFYLLAMAVTPLWWYVNNTPLCSHTIDLCTHTHRLDG